MWQEHEDLSESRLAALDSLVLEKKRIARIYDKRTRGLSFGEGDLVWKAVLPLGEKVHGRGKWSPRWEDPHIIDKILGKGAYHLRHLDGELHPNPINSRFLKKYYPSVWEFDDPPSPLSGQGGNTWFFPWFAFSRTNPMVLPYSLHILKLGGNAYTLSSSRM